MASAAIGPAERGGGGPLSFMGCMREASPPPCDHRSFVAAPGANNHLQQRRQQQQHQQTQHNHHNHHHGAQGGPETIPKEPKKRRFHPLRGLRRIFRKKSRTSVDSKHSPGALADYHRDAERLAIRDREEVTLRDPSGRTDSEARSRSASELLTDACDNRGSLFLRKKGTHDESFSNLHRGVGGQLSVSHDSVFPGEVSHLRPLSTLEAAHSLERRQKDSNNVDHTDSTQRQRISLRVLQQIKTVIENRNQCTPENATNSSHNRLVGREKSERTPSEDTLTKVPRKESSTTSTPEFVTSSPKQQQSQDLPELPGGNLNHTAAHHRIHVRPKNRRPPRRSNNTTGSSNNDGSSTSILSNDQINTTSTTISSNSKIADDVSEPTSMIDGLQGTMQDSLEPAISTLDATFDDSIQAASSPIHVPPPPPPEIPHKPTSILRKSSSRASRTSLENGITLPTSSPVVVVPRKPPLSPDSLDTALQDASAKSSNEQLDQAPPPPPRPSPRPTSDAIVLDRRRPNRLSKSPDSLESGEWPPPRVPPETSPRLVAKPVAAARRLLLSKSSEIVCSKSSDSLEGLNSSDDSMERQTRRPPELISKSFETINSTSDQQHQQKRKRVTMSDVNLSRGGRIGGSGKLVWKSSEKEDNSCWRPPSAQLLLRPRTTTHSSESSDNLEYLDNQESKQRARRSMPCNVICGITRKPSTSSSNCRLQKSSESSELGSTDTLDSERRHLKSSDSDETLDSLEKDLDQVMKSSPVGTPDEFVWRTSRTSLHDIGNKDPNVDLHLSLIGYNKTNENGNHTPEEERTGPQLTKKNKTMNNSMIQAKTEEDLQNMLNGNISEVTTTDTKSFKEKLIMFEKLGK